MGIVGIVGTSHFSAKIMMQFVRLGVFIWETDRSRNIRGMFSRRRSQYGRGKWRYILCICYMGKDTSKGRGDGV